MNTADRRARLKEKDVTGLTILLSREDRERLNRMSDLANGILCTKVSQAALMRRAIRVYEQGLESELARLSLTPGTEDLSAFLRSEKKAVFEANGIQDDGQDPAKEYPQVAAEEIQALRTAIRGLNAEEIRHFLKTGVKPTIQ